MSTLLRTILTITVTNNTSDKDKHCLALLSSRQDFRTFIGANTKLVAIPRLAPIYPIARNWIYRHMLEKVKQQKEGCYPSFCCLACPTGFEPAASRVGVSRAIQLCHGQMMCLLYHFFCPFSSYILKNPSILFDLSLLSVLVKHLALKCVDPDVMIGYSRVKIAVLLRLLLDALLELMHRYLKSLYRFVDPENNVKERDYCRKERGWCRNKVIYKFKRH